MQRESGGQTTRNGRPIISSTGAMGLMQVMPNTFAEMRSKLNLGADPYDPHDNIAAGVGYLRELYEQYGYPNLFAAYNAGPKRLDEFLFTGKPLPEETESYLDAVLPRTVSSAETGQREPRNGIPTRSRMRKKQHNGDLFVDHPNDADANNTPVVSDELFVFRAPTNP